MSTLTLQKSAHIFQMLGNIDEQKKYSLPHDIAMALFRLKKIQQRNKDDLVVDGESDGAAGHKDRIIMLRSIADPEIEFCLEALENKMVLNLVERVWEMGGMYASSYLTPLAEIVGDDINTEENWMQFGFEADVLQNEDGSFVDWLGEKIWENEADLKLIRDRKKYRRRQFAHVQAEQERLCHTANKQIKKILDGEVASEVENMIQASKRFVRAGKPDFNQAQLQITQFVIQKNKLLEDERLIPVVAVIDRCERACERIADKERRRAKAEPTQQNEPLTLYGADVAKREARAQRREMAFAKMASEVRARVKASKPDFEEFVNSTGRRKPNLKLQRGDRRAKFVEEHPDKSKTVVEILDTPMGVDAVLESELEMIQTREQSNIKGEIEKAITDETVVLQDGNNNNVAKTRMLASVLVEQYKENGRAAQAEEREREMRKTLRGLRAGRINDK